MCFIKRKLQVWSRRGLVILFRITGDSTVNVDQTQHHNVYLTAIAANDFIGHLFAKRYILYRGASAPEMEHVDDKCPSYQSSRADSPRPRSLLRQLFSTALYFGIISKRVNFNGAAKNNQPTIAASISKTWPPKILERQQAMTTNTLVHKSGH